MEPADLWELNDVAHPWRFDCSRHGTVLVADWFRRIPAALPSPVELESLTMPPNDGRWLHDDQRRAPATPEPGHQGPEDAITGPQPRSLDGSAQDGQLLAQREILSDQDGSALDEDSKQVKKGLQHYFRSFLGGT